MSEPVSQEAIIETSKGVVATAGGGGLIAVLLEFFRGRERQRSAERIAHLEGRLNGVEALLMRLLDKLEPKARHGRRKRARRTGDKAPGKK